MPDTVVIEGAEQLAALAKRLRAAGRKDLKRELNAAITRSTKELRTRKLKESAVATLPRRGGLGRRVAKSRIASVNRATGVRIQAKDNAIRRELRRIDGGEVRHPVYATGPRSQWHWTPRPQHVKAGWFTRPVEDAAPGVRRAITAAMDDVVRQLDHPTA